MQSSNPKQSNNQLQVLLAATIMTSGQIAPLDSNIFAMTAKLKRKSKRADINSIHAHAIKTVDFDEITKHSRKNEQSHFRCQSHEQIEPKQGLFLDKSGLN